MRKLILSLFITIVCASAVQAQSTFYTVQQLEEAMNGDRIIAFWTYLHKQGSSNLALKGIRLDSLMIAMDSMIGSGGGGSGPDYYQTIRLNGVNANQRQALNFVNNPGVFQFNVTDDSGSGETEVTGTVTGLDLTSSSTAIIVTNGAGTTLKNTQLDLDPSQIILSTLGGELNLTQISDGGAATGDVLQWNGTAWVPADVSGGGGSYVAGAGIDITGITISNTGDLLVTNEGDLSVIEDSPTQVSLISNTSGSTNVLIVQGDGIDVTANEITNTLTITNTGDTDASDDLTDATIFDGDVTGTYNNLQIEPGVVGTPELANGAVTMVKINQAGATSGQVIKWNGSAWAPAADNTGGGGGGFYQTLQEEGVDITQRDKINFIGSSATASDDGANSRTNVTFDSDLNALADIATTGVYVITASGTSTTRTITAGTGISVTNGSGVGGNPTITNTGDLSATNELQIFTNSSDATNHYLVLSDGGGSITFAEGSGITLTTTGTAADAIVTIAATGGGSSNYQLIRDDGVDMTTRPNANFISTVDITFNLDDDGPNSETEIEADIPADAVDFAEMQNIATGTLIGRSTAGTGDPESITVSTGLSLSGGNLTATDASTTNEIQDLSITGVSSPFTLDISGSTNDVNFAAGTGISLSESPANTLVVTNSSPDLTVVLNSGTGINVTGTYPTFTIDAAISTAYQTVQEDGTGLTQRAIINFIGSSATAADNAGASRTDVTFDSDLNALASASTTGLYVRTGTGTSATRTLTGPAAGITVTNGNGVSGNPTLALANDLAGVEGLAGTGLAIRTATDTWTNRSVVAGTGAITVTNGDGVAGNITINNTDPDQSTTNELQNITNTSDATSHTATLSNSGGSIQFVEGSGISLTTTGTAADAIVTIAATGGGASNYQLLRDDGVDATVRPNANFVSNADIAFTLTDDGGSTETEITGDIPAQAVDFAEIQNVATGTLVGRSTAGSGSVEQITVSTGLSISGGNLTATDASITNEVLTISDGTDSEAMGGQTLTVSGALGITADYVPATNTLTISGIGATAYQTIQEEGTGLTQRSVFNFIGSTATAADDAGNSRTNVTFDSDVNALASTASTGAYVITGVGTSATRTLTGPAAGITVTNGNGVSGNPTLALANDLSALEGLAGTGIPARTAADTWALRTITAGSGITVSNGSGATGNPTIDATDPSLSNEGSLTVVAGGANDSQIQSNTSGSTNITISGLRGLLITESGSTITAGLPTGTTNYGLRFNGTDWVSSAQLQNNDTEIGIGGAPIAGIELYVNGRGRFDATIESQGVGVPTGSANAAAVRLINTTAITGDTWYLGSLNDGTFALQSGNAGSVLTTETDGTIATVYDFKIGDVTGITPTTIIGRDASGYVGTVAVGSGLSLSGGTLSATGGGGSNYQTIQEEGVAVTQRAIFNFIGSTATAADNVTKTDITFDSDVNALASTASTGLYAVTGSGTSATRTLTGPAAGITVTNGNGVSGNPTLALANDLSALEGLAGTGIGVRTAADTWTNRSVVAGTGAITVTNGDGVAGNITINNTDPDQSTTNEVLTISDGTDSEAMGGQTLTVAGAGGITADYVPATNTLTITGAASGNYQTIQEEGVAVTQRATFNFIGSSATAADDAPNTRTNITFDSDLNALASTASTGLYAVTGVGTSATRTLTGPAAGITVTNGNGVSGNPTLALANDLSAVEGLAGTGLAVRTAADTWTNRTITAGSGISVTNGDGVSGNPTISASITTAYQTVQEEGTGLTQRATINFIGSSATASDNVGSSRTDVTFDSDLNALASTAATGLYAITGTGTSATRTLTGPAAGITVTNGNGVSGNPTLALANDLSALEGLAGTGIGVRTAADTWTNRSVVAGTGAITVTNGDGVSGNITINNTDPDQSTTNEVVTISDGVNSEAMGGQTLTVAGGGINVATYNGATNTLTITGNEVDGSITNELQNITSSSNATSHTVTLSNSGGSIQFVEGSNITLTTTGTAADAIVTIASTGGGGGSPAGADFQVQYYNGGAFGAEAAFNYNPTLNRLVVGHTSATAVLHARGADDVADRAFLAENFSANDILTIFTTGRTKWGDNETYPYVYQAPSAGGTASYTANGLSFESDLVATTGVDLFSFKNQTSTNSTGGPYSIVRSTGTWAPTSGSAIYNSITANPTINATSTASGKANMFNGTPTITQASGGVNIFNAAPTVTAASGGLRGYYSDIASGTGIYQLFMDGTAQSRFDGVVGIKTDAAAGYDLHVTGPTRVDATIESRGTGTPTGGTAAAAVRLINTGGGDTWYLGSVSTGEFVLQSGNSSTVLTGEADGTIKTTYDFRIGDVTGITPTTVIGRDADGDVGTVTLGSGVALSNGELPLWNSNDAGAITSITTTALVDVTGLSFDVVANKKYEFWACIKYSAAATTTGSAWSINGPAGTVQCFVESGLTNTTTRNHWQNAVNTLSASASSAYTTGNIAYVRGIVEPTADGTYIIRGGTEVAGSAITVQGVSVINWREIK